MPTAETRMSPAFVAAAAMQADGISRDDDDVDDDEHDSGELFDAEEDESRRVSSSPSPLAGASWEGGVESRDEGGGDDESRDSGGESSDGDSGVDVVVPVGELAERMDPNSGRCWSCLVRLRPGDDRGRPPPAAVASSTSSVVPKKRAGFLYSTHTHPLLDIAVCSVCEERTSAVESDVVDIEPQGGNDGGRRDDDGEDGTTANACSWCGLEDDELGEHDVRDSIPCSDLLLCDSCPRAFCVRCVILSHGGDVAAWEEVRRHTTSGSGSGSDDEEWRCPHCCPTSFLGKLRDAHARMTGDGDVRREDDGTRGSAFVPVGRASSHGGGGATGDGEEARSDDDPDVVVVVDGDDEDSRIRGILEELDYAEDSMEEAMRHLDEARIERERNAIELELVDGSGSSAMIPPEDLEWEVRAELDRYLRRWRTHIDRLGDTIARLHEELDLIDVGVMEGYYRYRREREDGRSSDGAGGMRDRMALKDFKISADLFLERRDAREGFSKGEFRGASGYKPKDPLVLKLEPEDLNDQCLNEIVDVNTLEGAISQMQSNANGGNPWRSRTGTTELDIEMFRNKAVQFEKINLGDLIDLDLLERRCITDKDDAMATKMEDAMEVRRTGSTRVVKRSVPLRALKDKVRKESTEYRLAEDTEYQPRLPRQNDSKMPATVPKAKKRAELQRLSTKLGSNAADSGRLSPTMRGLLIGDDTAEYMDSNFKLEVENCCSKVTVCRSLATLLKEHQKEGLKFCWRNVCSKIMNPKEEGDDEIHGAILAHNMGLGKSFQAVCLLHTLLTHPSLIKANGRRIVRTALLIAPVNTLANWETELQKWVGTSSGRSIPGILFYPWNDQRSKVKIVKEWYECGGILCVSTEKYASACKDYLDADKRNFNVKQGKSKKSTTPVEDDAFLRKALFKPGPDIVVLDEVHSMLKSNSTNIYKVLSGLGTRLRLGLTGSPIQNNLYEYYRMASWVSPGCLGTEAHFTKTFHDPIMDGMAADCSPLQAEKQEQVSNSMHSILSKKIHRRDADVLARDLPFLQETIIHVRQSKAQTKLYREFRKHQSETDNKNFFKQYHALRPISNHPAVKIIFEDKRKFRPDSPLFDDLKDDDACAKTDNLLQPRVAPSKYAWICDKCNIAKFRTLDEAEAHEETCDGNYNADTMPDDFVESKIPTQKGDSENEEWWISFAERAEKSDLDIKAIEHGGKIVLLLQIIAHCDRIGDKVVVFSQSLPTLSYIEEILNSPDWGGFKFFLPDNIRKQKLGGWRRNQEYLRIDGSVDAKERGDLIDTFHSNTAAGNQSKLFLLSTNAGGLGINLIAANRVVLFDSHWNPAVDLQAVYRCYRYGQTKPTFCYRLLAEGSMEQKIYSRAATKTSLSDLVIDQTNPERSFTKRDMDLLRVEDTWVCCTACNKWRMLPPDISAEEVQNLPDDWYCKDNIYDPARSKCAAEERSGVWMLSFFERRAREEDDSYVQSQGSASSYCEKVTADFRPAFDMRHQEYTERDTVLQNLIDRSEDKTANTSDNASSGKKTWVSKWDFNFDKSEKLESAEDKQEQEHPPQPIKISSPTKMKLLKSPGKVSPPKTNKAKSEFIKPQSPHEKMHKSPPGSTGTKRKHPKSLDKSERNTSRSPCEEMQRKNKSLDKWQRGATGEAEEQSPSDRGLSDKKQKVGILAEKNEAKVEEEDEEPKLPHAKRKTEEDNAVVDLTFSDSDCA